MHKTLNVSVPSSYWAKEKHTDKFKYTEIAKNQVER
jgi:hypothetical protein